MGRPVDIRVVEDLILQGLSRAEISQMVGAHVETIGRIIREHGLPYRSRRGGRRTYAVDPHSFDAVDECSAWAWGFLIGDGCIRRSGTARALSVAVKSSDGYVLDFIKAACGSEHPVRVNTTFRKGVETEEARLVICSNELCDSIRDRLYERIPVVPFESSIDVDVANRHVLRGYFDADGSVYRRTRGDWVVRLGSQSKRAIEVFLDSCSVGNRNIKEYSSGFFEINLGAEDDLVSIAQMIYPPGTSVFLRRKAERFGEFLREVGSTPCVVQRSSATGRGASTLP